MLGNIKASSEFERNTRIHLAIWKKKQFETQKCTHLNDNLHSYFIKLQFFVHVLQVKSDWLVLSQCIGLFIYLFSYVLDEQE